MSTTPNLLISLLAGSQNNKAVTVNDAFDDFDGAITGLYSAAMANADVTLTDSEALYNMVFLCTGSNTAIRNLIVPQNKKLYIVSNQTGGGFDITVTTGLGTSVSVAPPAGSLESYDILYCDGTNVVLIASSASAAGVTAFIELLDVPSSYSGAASDLVTVNSAATGLQFQARSTSISASNPGVDTNNHVWYITDMLFAIKFPAGAANSIAKCGTNATSSATYTLKKNGTSFATIVFTSASATGTWTQSSDASFSAGDVLELDGPSAADSTLANIRINLYGIRS